MIKKMSKIKHLYKSFERFFASVKFAVIIISLFAFALTIGTFVESYNGTPFANKVIYKSWWFMGIQGLMLLSIVMATIVRLPAKKHLYGFYTVHLGLVILFLGSLVTYLVGIDGSIQLLPNKPARKILIDKDQIKIQSLELGESFTYPLPYTGYATKLDQKVKFGDITLKEYYPSASSKLKWEKLPNKEPILSAQYLIFNDNVAETITLSLSPISDYQSSKKMGPLTVHLMPEELLSCFTMNNPSKFVIWYTEDKKCSTPQQENLTIDKTDKGNNFITLEYKNQSYKFLPEFTPLPVNDDLTKIEESPIRVLSLDLFTKKPHLFTFGDSIVYFKKRSKKWILKKFENDDLIRLPWMGFQLKKIRTESSLYPLDIPSYVKPIQDNNKIIQGEDQALRLEVGNNEYWITDKKPLQLSSTKGILFIQFIKKTYTLPYQLTLAKFVMQKNPGTNDPASFESYVELLDGRKNQGIKKFHVFMNNPLKYDDFTFYQSSYFPVGLKDNGEQEFASVLSVNYDPGRKFKYFGSLLIVLGSIWHFYLRKRKKR